MNSFITSLQYRIPDLKIIKHNKGFAVNWPEGYQEGIRCIFTRKYINIDYREYHPRKNAKVALDRLIYFLKSYQPLIILPNEILALIIDYLIGDIKSLSALGCCSKLLNKLTDRKKAYYKEKFEKIGLPSKWMDTENLTFANYQVLLERPKIIPRIYPFEKLHEKDVFFDHTDKIMKWKGKNPYCYEVHEIVGKYHNRYGYEMEQSKGFYYTHLYLSEKYDPDPFSHKTTCILYIKENQIVGWNSSSKKVHNLYCFYIRLRDNCCYYKSNSYQAKYYKSLAKWYRKRYPLAHVFYFTFDNVLHKSIMVITEHVEIFKCQEIYPIPVSHNFNETYQSWLKEKKIKLDQISQVMGNFFKKLNTNSDIYSDKTQQENIDKFLNDFYYNINCCLR